MQGTAPINHVFKINEITEFILSFLFFGVSFYIFPWYLTIILYLLILFTTKKQHVIAVYAAFTFYNLMLTKDAPFWTSLISSFGGLVIVLARIGILKRHFPVFLFIPFLLVFVFIASFLFFSINQYYYLTGLKSLLQLVFLLSVIISFMLIPDRYLVSAKKYFDKIMPLFIISYLVLAIVFYDRDDPYNNGGRFGAGTGPQCLAIQMAFLLCYFSNDRRSNRAFQFLLLVAVFLTGSRTYFVLAGMLLVYDYFKKSSLKIKLIVLINAFIISTSILFLLPLTKTRFDYTSASFWGTLMGRLKFYEHGLNLFKEHPLTGNGMGSMLRVLETWSHREGFEHYKIRGDTTIVHNEYLRVLIETGLVGFGLIITGVIYVWKAMKELSARYILLLFLLGSMVENTLALYTTGALLFLILLFFIKVKDTAAYKESETNTLAINP
jgi:O-antigen ligase